ncbi:MAG: hypothetical protein JXR37_06245 [Kiritimatiellae bacterium]|nr:hypothetical protein [Kiritimatiellia bacterium]
MRRGMVSAVAWAVYGVLMSSGVAAVSEHRATATIGANGGSYRQEFSGGGLLGGDRLHFSASSPHKIDGSLTEAAGFDWTREGEDGAPAYTASVPWDYAPKSHEPKIAGHVYPGGSGGEGAAVTRPYDFTGVVDCRVDLVPEKLDANCPLDGGRICLNAQERYKRAKFKAVVRPLGEPATVMSPSGSLLRFAKDGSGPWLDKLLMVKDGDTIWAQTPIVGDFTARIFLDSNEQIKADKDIRAFVFEIERQKVEGSGTTALIEEETGGYNEYGEGDIQKRKPDTLTYKLLAKTTPQAGVYKGKVRVKADIKYGRTELTGAMAIERKARLQWWHTVNSFSLSVPMGPLSLSVTAPSGSVGATCALDSCLAVTFPPPDRSTPPQLSSTLTRTLSEFDPWTNYRSAEHRDFNRHLVCTRIFDLGATSEPPVIYAYAARGICVGASRNATMTKACAHLHGAEVELFNESFEIVEPGP